jgi:DNA polymerase-3 subunit beta
MTSGKFKAKMPTLPVADFPSIESRPGTKFTIKSGVLKHLIRRVEVAVPSKEGKFSIPVIHFEGTAELLRAVATDGFRIAVSDAPPVGVFVLDLPKTALPVLKEFRGEEIQFSETETRFFFATDKEILQVQKSVAKFPAYQRALNSVFTASAPAPSNDFSNTLALLDPLTDTTDPRTLMQIGNGAITLSTTSVEGDGEEVLDAITEGNAFQATLNPKYIQDFLGQAEGQAVKIQGSTEKAPVLFSREDMHGPYRYYLMPIQPKSAEKKA